LLKPNKSSYYYNRGLTLIELREYNNAIADFKKACDMGNNRGCVKYLHYSKSKTKPKHRPKPTPQPKEPKEEKPTLL